MLNSYFKFQKVACWLAFLSLIGTFKCLAQQGYLIQNIESQLSQFRSDVLSERETVFGYTFGVSISLGNKSNGSLRGYANIGFLQKVSRDDFHVLVGGQSHLEIFRGGLGSSLLNSNKFKLNFEIRNSVIALMGLESNNRVSGKPAFVNVGSDASSLFDPLDYSISVGTTFINGINHSRHQKIGTFSASINQWSVQYYNDGPPFGFLGLGDRYDRYWTGGGQMGFYFKNDSTFLTDVVLRYDNYTGYQLNLYEVGSVLQIDDLPYLIKPQQMYNQARFQYKFGIQNSFYVNGSVWEPLYSDIQNLIHYHISVSPFHARPLQRRVTIDFDYVYNFNFNDQ